MDKVDIYTDGAARGNPGRSASGFAVFINGRLAKENAVYNGIQTNNYAEYTAAINALEWCSKNIDAAACEVTLTSDSELMIKQINKEYKTKSANMKALNKKLIVLSSKFQNIKFKNVKRSNPNISRVDKKLNLLLDRIEAESD